MYKDVHRRMSPTNQPPSRAAAQSGWRLVDGVAPDQQPCGGQQQQLHGQQRDSDNKKAAQRRQRFADATLALSSLSPTRWARQSRSISLSISLLWFWLLLDRPLRPARTQAEPLPRRTPTGLGAWLWAGCARGSPWQPGLSEFVGSCVAAAAAALMYTGAPVARSR